MLIRVIHDKEEIKEAKGRAEEDYLSVLNDLVLVNNFKMIQWSKKYADSVDQRERFYKNASIR